MFVEQTGTLNNYYLRCFILRLITFIGLLFLNAKEFKDVFN